jgi:hypothetical protein
MFYKKVEKTSDSSSLGFQKSVTSADSTLDNEVLFTYANLDNTSAPYGNLFKSLRLPITTDEIDSFTNTHKNTAMSYLNSRQIIVAEIPKGQYGELIDGKTFSLKIPVVLGGVESSTTIYGSYFGFNGKFGTGTTPTDSITFNKQLNVDLFERQYYVGDLGSSENMSNITFLYSNEIQKPTGSRDVQVLLAQTTISLNKTAINETTAYVFSTVSASTGDIIYFEIKSDPSSGKNPPNPNDVSVTVGGGVQVILKNDVTVVTTSNISNSPIKMYFNNANPSTGSFIVKISKVATSSLSWDRWTTSNKFPKSEDDFTSGKRYASYDGFYVNFPSATKFVKSYDKPVGILYNDKGLAVITDSTLVSGFRYSAATSSGFNGISSGSPYNSDTNFAKIYFTSSTLSEVQYKSVTTELVQNVMCIAMPNEYFYTNNSTYPDSYDESVTNRPTFITSLGLYNKYGELIGIGKMSEPVKKETGSIVPFNVKLKL